LQPRAAAPGRHVLPAARRLPLRGGRGADAEARRALGEDRAASAGAKAARARRRRRPMDRRAAGEERPAKEGKRAPPAGAGRRGLAALVGREGGSVVPTRAGKHEARAAIARAPIALRRLTHATDVDAADARALLRERNR